MIRSDQTGPFPQTPAACRGKALFEAVDGALKTLAGTNNHPG